MEGPSTSTNGLSFLPNELFVDAPNEAMKEPEFDAQEEDVHDRA